MYEDKIVYHNFAYKTTLDHKYTRENGIEVVVRWSNEKYYTSSIIEAYPLPSPYMDVKTYRFDGQLMEKGRICRTLDLTLDYSFPRVGKWIEYDNYNEVYKVVNYGKERAYKKILTFIEEKGYLEGLTDDGLALISSFFITMKRSIGVCGFVAQVRMIFFISLTVEQEKYWRKENIVIIFVRMTSGE
jgi:hypothetical protein